MSFAKKQEKAALEGRGEREMDGLEVRMSGGGNERQTEVVVPKCCQNSYNPLGQNDKM